MESTKLTGYPSMDKPWMKFYSTELSDIGIDIDTKATVWDVLEEKFSEHSEIPALEYFGKIFTRDKFKSMVYEWAKIFKNLGIIEEEVVPIYGCLTPDIAAMTFALNMIGAVPYFLKLAISEQALAEETIESRFAIVFDDMWDNVSCEFSKEKYKKVLIYSVTDSMGVTKKAILSLMKKKNGFVFTNDRMISLAKAKKLYSSNVKELKAEYKKNRRAFITSSSGTTVGGVVKGTVATNESTIAQLFMASASGTLCDKGDRALNNLPPTAATSLNLLLFLVLFRGATIIIDPRISKEDFYNQLKKYRPNFVLTTGSFWETFFTKVKEDLKISVTTKTIQKEADGTIESPFVIAQKQEGLYAVEWHPIGGSPDLEVLSKLNDAIQPMQDVVLRIAPFESVYIINLTAKEAQTVLDIIKNDTAKTTFETSVSCIGATICQQGLRDSQGLLKACVAAVQEANIKDGALPQIYISGCPSSCGTHQTGIWGFRGHVKMVDKKPQSAFMLYINGNDTQGEERMGKELGPIQETLIPEFVVKVGKAVEASGLTFEEWYQKDPAVFEEIAKPYTD